MTRSGSGAHRQVADLAARVAPPSGADPAAVRAHLDHLTKPPGSLGRLEDVAVRLARIVGDPPPPLAHRVVCVLAGDHGVTAHGVSAYPAEVTAQMCANLARGGAAVSVLARQARCELVVADFGVARTGPAPDGVVDLRIRPGTRDLSVEPAMSAEEVASAVLAGAGMVAGRMPAPDVVCVGEMGIGNSTAAAALTVLLTGCPVDRAVGSGTGVAGRPLERKRAVVRSAVRRVREERAADGGFGGSGGLASGPAALDALRQVGGLEIAGLVGVTLEAAAAGVPVVVDGFIATAAALAAARLAPPATDFLFASHRSTEPGHAHLLGALGLDPLLHLGLRLGEGTGAVLALPLLDAAGAVLREMATFQSAGVSGPST